MASPVQTLARGLALLVALLALLVGAGVARAYQPPPLRGHVHDTAGVLSSGQVRELDADLDRVRRDHHFDIAVLIVPTLADEPIEDIAYDTFNTWGVGDEGLDNGVLLVLAVAEQRVRIETGKGVGGELTDIESGRIIREQIKPRVEAGQWYAAVDIGTRAIEEALTGVASPRGPPPASVDEPTELSLVQTILLFVGLIVVIGLAVVFPGFRRFLFWFVLIFFRRGGGGGGGGFGGGGGSGGGGRSGGGGASG